MYIDLILCHKQSHVTHRRHSCSLQYEEDIFVDGFIDYAQGDHERLQTSGLGVVSLTFHKLSQNILRKFVYWKKHPSYENFKLKLCMCAQSHALGTRTKFQLEILTINVISGIVYFHNIILESSQNISEPTPRPFHLWYWKDTHWTMWIRLLKSVLTHLSIQTHCQHWGCRCHLYIHHSAGCQCWPCRYTSHQPHNCGCPRLYQVCNSYNLWEGKWETTQW